MRKKTPTARNNPDKRSRRHFRLNGTKTPRLRHTPEAILPFLTFEHSGTEEALQLLTRRLLQAQEDERRSVARELHDGLNQTLAMLGVEVSIALDQLPSSARSARRQLQQIRVRVEQLSEEVRQISHRLHPALLEHLGLVSALRSYCSEFEESRRIEVRFVCEGSTSRIPFSIATCLYRIVQEALNNVAKHANASHVVIRLHLGEHDITLSLADNGQGFRVQPGRTPGLGLISMEERAQIVGGRFSIESSVGTGTKVEVVVPAKETSKWEPLSEITSPGK
ncbi:MAG TPA: sensor histidine kinase [Terriglobia bacterium]|nr:sensor histidine kinase [Terriglobia bacterium]